MSTMSSTPVAMLTTCEYSAMQCAVQVSQQGPRGIEFKIKID